MGNNGQIGGKVGQKIQGSAGQERRTPAPGYTFFPHVSEEGILSWTNNGGFPNPEPVSLRGKTGAQGIQGIPGEKGPDGERGTQGKQGSQGIQGIPGRDGKDGVSPLVNVASIPGGYSVTITDAEGVRSFNVFHGKDGVQPFTPEEIAALRTILKELG